MRNKQKDRLPLLIFPVLLLLLFVINLTADSRLSTVTAIASVAVLIGFIAYVRSERYSRRFPIERLITKEDKLIVFDQLYGSKQPPLKLPVEGIYALNFSYHYLGVIVDKNGKGYDFYYPHKASVIEERLKRVIGNDIFDKIKINT